MPVSMIAYKSIIGTDKINLSYKIFTSPIIKTFYIFNISMFVIKLITFNHNINIF